MTRIVPLLGLGLLLAGCGHRDEDVPANTEQAVITFSNPGNAGEGGPYGSSAQTVGISVPGFAAKLNLPGLDLGAGNTALDGIALQPGTRLTAMKISGAAGDGSGGEGHGTVEMGFATPAAPPQVIDYYRRAAKGGGWIEVPPAAGQQFAATKTRSRGAEHLALQVSPAGTGSQGRFVVTGS